MQRAIRSVIYLLAAVAVSFASVARAGSYPDRPIHVVVPYAPGGIVDLLARSVGKELTSKWGQAVIVKNIPGGGATIGSYAVAKAAPDGYTLLFIAPSYAINPSLRKTMPYTTHDFTPVTMLARAPLLLVVHPNLKVKSVRALIARAKDEPGKINFASGGFGTTGYLALALFEKMTDTHFMHIPYKGVGPALPDLLAGRDSAMFAPFPMGYRYVKAHKLLPLGVGGEHRDALLPNVPTVAQAAVPGFDLNPWFGVVAPAGTPHAIVASLAKEIAEVMRMQSVSGRLTKLGIEIQTDTPEQFAAFIDGQVKLFAPLIKKAGAKVN